MTPEGRVKAKIRAVLKTYAPDVWYFMPVSGGYGKHGVPDFVCCVKGHFVAIECKAGAGRLTELQQQTQMKISNAQGVAIVLNQNNVDGIEQYLLMWGCKKG